MAVSSIKTNIASENVQRWLLRSTASLSKIASHLSSGLRINTASDDAAGLAIAAGLKTDGRVSAQAVRNVNDGVSALSIAEGGLDQLSTILIRIAELAEQSSNGVLSSSQRISLHREAAAMVDEYNRIVQTTQFNGRNLLDGTFSEVGIQVGYADQSINVGVASIIGSGVGDGTFKAGTAYATGDLPYSIAVADLNGDGYDDVVSGDINTAQLTVRMGSESGTLGAATQYVSAAVQSIQLRDVNNDGHRDIVSALYSSGMEVRLNNGSGGFSSSTIYSMGPQTEGVVLADFDGDGDLDAVAANANSGTGSLTYRANIGSGTFGAVSTLATGMGGNVDIAVGDFDGDHNQDLVVADQTNTRFAIVRGLGNGTFVAPSYVTTASGTTSVAVGDFDNDGDSDVAVNYLFSNQIQRYSNNGLGTFSASGVLAGTGLLTGLQSTDLNGDGNLDFIANTSSAGSVNVFLSQGGGTYAAPITLVASGTAENGLGLGDINNDGAIDIVGGFVDGAPNHIYVFLGNSSGSSRLSQFDLTTISSSLEALDDVKTIMSRVHKAVGSIGSQQSRLSVAANVLKISNENTESAASRILDVDVATESADYVRTRFLQEAGAAILAQANQQPALALTLLQNIGP